MRIAVLDTCYPAFLNAFYAARPGLARRPYEEQLAALMEFSFGTSDAYTRGLEQAGHEAINLVTNCVPLQLRWLRENGHSRTALRLASRLPGRLGGGASFEVFQRIADVQVRAYDPEVVFVHDMTSMRRSTIDGWRSQGRFLMSQIASPAPSDEVLKGYDLILSSFHHFVERFRALGIDSRFQPLAFYDRILDRLARRRGGATARWERDVAFVGGVDPTTHTSGTAFLERVSAAIDLDVWGYGAHALSPGSPILRRYHGEAWGLDMYEILAGSKVALNRHIDVAEGQANNMRLYEATGVGSLLLTEAGRDLEELFEPGVEVVTYEGADDLVDKARHYLEHDDERERIAAAGQARTLRDHTYTKRMAEISGMLAERLG